MAWPVTLNGRTYTSLDFLGSAYVSGIPDLMQDAATHFANGYVGNSTSSVAIGTGTKTFTVEANKLYAPGQPVTIASVANPSTVYMDGRVTSYNPSTGVLVVNVGVVLGSGTLAAWTITIGGARVSASLPLSIAEGGQGATTAPQALTNLGVTSVGQTLIGQATQTLMRTVGLGFSSFGESVASAADAAAGRTLLGISGVAGTLLSQTTQALMRTAGLGITAFGDSVLTAADAAATRTLLGISGAAGTLVAQTTQALMRTTGLGITSTGESLVTAASASAGRTALGFDQAIVQIVDSGSTTASTGTTIMPGDDTLPQNTEGDQYLTTSITPSSSTNRLLIEVVAHSSHSVTDVVVSGGLFKDSVASAICAGLHYTNSAKILPLILRHDMEAGTTDPITFNFRMGGSVAGTTYFNRNITGRLLGGAVRSSIRITEYTP